ncbi:MAG: tetratricopeptide repeat protein, partial [Roseimicrobium sp.]
MNPKFAVKPTVRRSLAAVLLAVVLPCTTYVFGLDQPSASKTTHAGDAEALFLSGRAFDRGDGVPQDFAKAREMYEKAAAQGHARAMNNLGSMYFHGRGVAKDDKAALDWFRKSAEGGADLAQITLGVWFQEGHVVKPDVPAAVEWFQRAAKQGNANAQRRLASIYYEGAEGVAKDYTKAASFVKPLAEAGDPWAMNTLGVMHEFGYGMPKEDAVALQWI